jgi:uncharacterized membrane protein
MTRVERSIQIALPCTAVFEACARIERAPGLIRFVASVASQGDVSRWIAEINGRRYSWELEIIQVIPNRSIGWASHGEPQHSGKINFFSLGGETLLQVDMNYAPPQGLAGFVAEQSLNLGDMIEAALHDLKQSIESIEKRKVETIPHSAPQQTSEDRATGTYGPLRGGAIREEYMRLTESDERMDDDLV